MAEILPTYEQFEIEVTRETVRKHQKEIEIMTGLLNTLLDGFNLVTSFTREEGKNDITYALIHLVMHSLHSMRCSARLMIKGYYSQTMALIRTSIEDWFICRDCQSYQKTLEAILNGNERIPSREACLFIKWLNA